MKLAEKANLDPPTYENFLELRASLLKFGETLTGTITTLGGLEDRLFIRSEERLVEESNGTHRAALRALLVDTEEGQELSIRYSEHSAITNIFGLGPFVKHDYRLDTNRETITNYAYSTVDSPKIPLYSLDVEVFDLESLDLSTYDGVTQLDLTTGECGVLYDRIVAFK